MQDFSWGGMLKTKWRKGIGEGTLVKRWAKGRVGRKIQKENPDFFGQKSDRLEDGVHGGACVWRAGSLHTDFAQGFVQRGMKSYHASEQKHHVIRSVSERARLVRTSSGETREEKMAWPRRIWGTVKAGADRYDTREWREKEKAAVRVKRVSRRRCSQPSYGEEEGNLCGRGTQLMGGINAEFPFYFPARSMSFTTLPIHFDKCFILAQVFKGKTPIQRYVFEFSLRVYNVISKQKTVIVHFIFNLGSIMLPC